MGDAMETVLQALSRDPSVTEVIVSGGDPLMLRDSVLARMIKRLEVIPQLRTLRIHTRMPVVLPSRISHELIAMFKASRLTPVIVIHANHPQEFDDSVAQALARFKDAGIWLLNQTVLLKGVNDDAGTLQSLSETLFANGVMPYYLHLLDRVAGATHFEVPESQAIAIMDTVRAALPGYLVPRMVREVPGAPYKKPISS